MADYNDSLPKVLFVDDEEDNLLVFRSSFRRNFEIMTAGSAAEGLKILESFTPDLIISDQRMPQLNGVEFLNSLPDSPLNIRMILSGFSDTDTLIYALNKGKIYQYLKKPWEKNELMQVMKDAMQVLEAKRLAGNDVISDSKGKPSERGNVLGETEISQLKKQEEDAFRNMQMLSKIGQDIISNLTISTVVDSAYENINSLMDATVFAIGIFEEEKETLMYSIMERGVKFEEARITIHSDEKPGAWTFNNRKEIFTNDWKHDYKNYIKGDLSAVQGEICDSMIYLPLFIKDTAVGVITVQAFKNDAYTLNHLNILRNVAIYVATAIENAYAYHLIEKQKSEIELKNVELEHKVEQRTEELQQKNEEVLRQKDQLEATYSNVKLLSEIGQQITSTLSLEKIIETVYENVNSLMDATVFGIGIYNPPENRLDFLGTMEKGVKLPFVFIALDEENRIPVWCFKNQKEVIMNDFQTEYNKYIKTIQKPKAGDDPDSILYLPLMTINGPIGVITVQSFKKHIYNQYHIDILRTLATYITIAIQNSTSYNKMTEAFGELKSAQTKLVESEKMASLGVLTAGVAHEINNPVNFISGGIESINENFTDLKELLTQISEPEKGKSPQQLWEQTNAMQKRIDLKNLITEMEMLISTIRNGASRTSEIVKGLRNFTRLDEHDMKKAGIAEGIDNTLVILNNKLKDRIEVIKNYEDLPDILCFPGQLNQVFMNILSNAADAIEAKGTIRINLKKIDNQAVISISDSGSGMPDDVKSHIFEPFYTTKEVGNGTGLGLSISYGIIEKHKGTIEVKSEHGKGTEFIITLPMNR